MKPYRQIAETTAPDGTRLTLHEHDGEYHLKFNLQELMSTTATASEILLGMVACKGLNQHAQPKVLIGGLGLGFSLRAVLENIRKSALVHVSELIPEVVTWNRELLAHVNGKLLDDRRVTVFQEDVYETIKRAKKEPYHSIILDVDNGPTSYVQENNSRLYSRRGFGFIRNALAPGGRVVFWAATEEPDFPYQLSREGFRVEVIPAKEHERAKRFAHRIYVAELLSK